MRKAHLTSDTGIFSRVSISPCRGLGAQRSRNYSGLGVFSSRPGGLPGTTYGGDKLALEWKGPTRLDPGKKWPRVFSIVGKFAPVDRVGPWDGGRPFSKRWFRCRAVEGDMGGDRCGKRGFPLLGGSGKTPSSKYPARFSTSEGHGTPGRNSFRPRTKTPPAKDFPKARFPGRF